MIFYDKAGVPLLYDVVPEEEQAIVIQMGEWLSANRWWIGDRANYWRYQARERMLPVGVMDVYEFFSQLLKRELSARTVAFYAEIAEFYPEDVRSRYPDLPFSMFSYAKRHHTLAQAEAILEVISDYAGEHGGRMPSESWLAMHTEPMHDAFVRQQMEAQQPQPIAFELCSVSDGLEYDIMEAGASVGVVATVRRATVEAIMAPVETLVSAADLLPVEDELKSDLKHALITLRDVLRRILSAWKD